MPTWLWRALTLAAIGVALVLIGGDLLHLTPSGDFGLTVTPLGAGSYRAESIKPNSPAAQAGIVSGARLTLPRDRFSARENIYFPVAIPGGTLELLVQQRGATRQVRLRIGQFGFSASEALAFSLLASMYQVIRIVFVLVAGAIVLRRAERADARALATFLVGISFAFTRWDWYGLTVGGVLQLIRPAVVLFGLMQAVRFAVLFPQASRRGIRRTILHINAFATVLVLIIVVYRPFTVLILDHALPANDPFELAVTVLVPLYLVGGLAVGFIFGAREAPYTDRARLRWVAVSTGIGVSGLIVAVGMEALQIPELAQTPFVFAMAAIPIGTAYAILRHRMLDIGFVVNRALVFGTISALVVGAFTLLEFLLGKYVTLLGHVQSAVLEALLALAIGVSLGRIHNRVDRLVDTVFFRERHRAEAALRRLAHDAPYVDEPNVLAQRVVAAVDRHARASGTALYLHDGNGAYVPMLATLRDAPPSIERNDAAVVRMRASGDPVDIEELSREIERPAFPGRLVFPMIVRGALIGALACGAKRDLEEYAPDEQATLAELAHAAGVAFDTLQMNALRDAVERALASGDVAPLRAGEGLV